MSSAVRAAVPEGASILRSWCSSMISTWSRCGAASLAISIMITAPIAKLGAMKAPTPRAAASCSMRSTCSGDIPVVPMTGDTSASSATNAFAAAASATEKSTVAAGDVAASASSKSSKRGKTFVASTTSTPATNSRSRGVVQRLGHRSTHAPGGAADRDPDHGATALIARSPRPTSIAITPAAVAISASIASTPPRTVPARVGSRGGQGLFRSQPLQHGTA